MERLLVVGLVLAARTTDAEAVIVVVAVVVVGLVLHIPLRWGSHENCNLQVVVDVVG